MVEVGAHPDFQEVVPGKKEWVIRSDVGEAHRLSLSARVLSAPGMQVKAKTTAAEALLTRFEKPPPEFQSIAKSLC